MGLFHMCPGENVSVSAGQALSSVHRSGQPDRAVDRDERTGVMGDRINILYQVITEEDKCDFEMEVEKAIAKGWKLQGGVCFARGEYHQAMIFDNSKKGQGDDQR
jgi:hypothetical protein